MKKNLSIKLAAALMILLSQPMLIKAGEADVVGVNANPGKDGSWTFSVTVTHDDKGWDHYADRWEVLGPDGEVLGTRVLYHPHVGEQPFTRSLGGVKVPKGLSEVVIRAHDLVHGYGGEEVEVELLDE